MGNMDRVLDIFPKGSTVGKTKAKAVIWENWLKPPKPRTMLRSVPKSKYWATPVAVVTRHSARGKKSGG